METKKEQASRKLANLVRQTLWMTTVHLARTFEIQELYRQLEEAERQGLVKRKSDGELHIFCYTQRCQVNPDLWTIPALLSRGLILWIQEQNDEKHIELLTTPFIKFFNFCQDGIHFDELIQNLSHFEITRKIDGSLGIIFWDPINLKWRVATKATFFSEQAVWATDFLHNNVDTSSLIKHSTYLAEIVYKQNKIIIPYNYEGLVLLAGFHKNGIEMTRLELATIERLSKTESKPGFRLVDTFKYDNLQEMVRVVKKFDGHKDEGVVVKLFLANGGTYRIKVKSEEYLLLHRNLSYTDKHILSAMIASQADLIELRNTIPDECLEDFDDKVQHLYKQAKAVVCELSDYISLLKQDGCKTKKDVGLWMKDRTYWPNGKKIIKGQIGLIYTGFQRIQDLEVGWCQLHKPDKPNIVRSNIFKLIKNFDS